MPRALELFGASGGRGSSSRAHAVRAGHRRRLRGAAAGRLRPLPLAVGHHARAAGRPRCRSMVLGPVFGAAADRWSRRCCVVVGRPRPRRRIRRDRAGRRASSATIALALLAGVGHRAVQAGGARGAAEPGRRDERLPAATSLFGAIADLGFTVGPALAARRCCSVSAGAICSFANGVTFVLSAFVLARLPFGAAPGAPTWTGRRLAAARRARRARARRRRMPGHARRDRGLRGACCCSAGCSTWPSCCSRRESWTRATPATRCSSRSSALGSSPARWSAPAAARARCSSAATCSGPAAHGRSASLCAGSRRRSALALRAVRARRRSATASCWSTSGC